MRKNTISAVIVLLATLQLAYAQNAEKYTYYVDLTRVVDDKVQVVLEVPSLSEDEIVFYMPKIVPGTYSIADYGRFVNKFKALDKKGRELPVERKDDNSWTIKNAKKLVRISYWVDDSFDYDFEENEIFWPAGTNIEEGKNFILNTSGFFGYFAGKKDMPFEFKVIRPGDFYGSTGLIRQEASPSIKGKVAGDLLQVTADERVDTYVADNYDHLVDSPLMYALPDTTLIQVGNTEVLIASYSPNKTINSKQIAQTMRETLMAQSDYLGGKLPVDKYAFIFYFTDEPVMSYGALEHSYSSMYYIPESNISRLEQTLRDFAAHEFFHIITPLTIHSEEIGKFDFNDPKMSKHLWLYEGVTEYFAGNVQVQAGLISPSEYIGMLREKLIVSQQFYDTVAFTDISRFTLDKYPDQYYNVYQKGALIGMCLDLLLLELSDGEMNLRDVVLKLSERYGKDQSFKDEELFDVIGSLTYPEIREFFSTYVEGETPIPYNEYFKKVGIIYQEKFPVETFTLGIESHNIGLDEETGKLKITNADRLYEIGKELGLMDGDLLVSINGNEVPPVGPGLQEFFQNTYDSLGDYENLTYVVLRDGKELSLSKPNRKITVYEEFVITPNPDATEEQMKLRDIWFGR